MLPQSITTIDNNEEKTKLEELYKKYRGLMLHVAIQILKNKELAEETIPDNSISTLDDLIAKDGYKAIKKAILALPESLKDVAYLNLICERNHEEIAKILGISNSASKMRLTRAKKAIREALAGENNGK